MSTTPIETWAGADLSSIGPIYPMVGTEFVLWLVGLGLWLLFHFIQAGMESRELQADEELARSPERVKRVFDAEAKERV